MKTDSFKRFMKSQTNQKYSFQDMCDFAFWYNYQEKSDQPYTTILPYALEIWLREKRFQDGG